MKLFRKQQSNYRIVLVLLASVLTFSTYAQDIIYKKDHTELKGKVLEVGLDEVKFRTYENSEGPIYVMKKSEISKIRYENGSELNFGVDKYAVNQESQILNKTKAIKFHFFSPLNGHLAFGYEQMIKVGMNFEGKLGIIGPSVGDALQKANGAFIKAGAKFLLGNSSDFAIEGLRYAHPLKGRYIKAEIAYSGFTVKDMYYSYYTTTPVTNPNGTTYYTYSINSGSTDVKVNSFAANLIYGRQWILAGAVTLEYYVGLGYGFSDQKIISSVAKNVDIGNISNHYGYILGGSSFPISLTGGLTIGYVLK